MNYAKYLKYIPMFDKTKINIINNGQNEYIINYDNKEYIIKLYQEYLTYFCSTLLQDGAKSQTFLLKSQHNFVYVIPYKYEKIF